MQLIFIMHVLCENYENPTFWRQSEVTTIQCESSMFKTICMSQSLHNLKRLLFKILLPTTEAALVQFIDTRSIIKIMK